jgi:hypothetical protein
MHVPVSNGNIKRNRLWVSGLRRWGSWLIVLKKFDVEIPAVWIFIIAIEVLRTFGLKSAHAP